MKIIPVSVLALIIVSATFAKPPPNIQDQLNTWIKDQPGGAAVAWVDASGSAFFTTGTFSPNDPRPITPDTQFELGSVSKLFTALLLAESERLGKVSRLDPAAKYLLPADDPNQTALAKITLLSLATHTSGLPRLPANIGSNPDANPNPYANYDREALIEGLRLHGPAAPAGRSVAYSNFGVAVLGEALASAWGTSFVSALETHVLTPLGMKETSVGLTGTPPPANLAPAHAHGKVVPNWTQQAFAPAGGMRSSARDMAVFLAACLGQGESPLRASIDATLVPQRSTEDTDGHIGLVWMLTDDSERSVAWHNGATAGSHAFVAFCRKTGEGIAILVNNQQGPEALGFALLGAKPPHPTHVAVKDAVTYVGRYPLNPTFAIDVTETNGSLFLQASGQPKLALREIAPDRFSVVGVPAEVSFERDAAGKITTLFLHQNGRDVPGPRQDLPPPPKEIPLPVETLREYVGDYPLAPTFVLTVTEENGALFVQATGQQNLPVFASARDEFFYKVVDAQLSFQRDAAGKVTGIVLHQNGHNTPGNRTEN